jgi:hypothetical protein
MSPPIQTNLFINGEYVPSSSGETLSIYSPVDDSLVADNVQVASEADVDRAVAAARAAFPAWRDTAGHKRAKCMLRFADLLERESERLAGLGRFLLSFLSDFSFIAFGFDFVISFVGDEERLALRPFSVRF